MPVRQPGRRLDDDAPVRRRPIHDRPPFLQPHESGDDHTSLEMSREPRLPALADVEIGREAVPVISETP
jgi:hypothetical protein